MPGTLLADPAYVRELVYDWEFDDGSFRMDMSYFNYCQGLTMTSKKFERLYKGRSAVERVNARLKIFWGADDGNVTGAPRFHAQVTAVLLVHIGLATLLAISGGVKSNATASGKISLVRLPAGSIICTLIVRVPSPSVPSGVYAYS